MTLCPSINPAYSEVHGTDTASLYVPNTFTPNGDGQNDYFIMFGKNISSLKCDIYRGNAIIYHVDSLNDYWDGIVNGEPTVDVYNVKIKGTTSWGSIFNLDGTISSLTGALVGLKNPPITQNTSITIKNAQFPTQGLNGVFDPLWPSGEYLVKSEVIVCH